MFIMNNYEIYLSQLQLLKTYTIVSTPKTKKKTKALIADLVEDLGFARCAQEMRKNRQAKENALFAIERWRKQAKLFNREGEDITPAGREEFYNKFADLFIEIVENVYS